MSRQPFSEERFSIWIPLKSKRASYYIFQPWTDRRRQDRSRPSIGVQKARLGDLLADLFAGKPSLLSPPSLALVRGAKRGNGEELSSLFASITPELGLSAIFSKAAAKCRRQGRAESIMTKRDIRLESNLRGQVSAHDRRLGRTSSPFKPNERSSNVRRLTIRLDGRMNSGIDERSYLSTFDA